MKITEGYHIGNPEHEASQIPEGCDIGSSRAVVAKLIACKRQIPEGCNIGSRCAVIKKRDAKCKSRRDATACTMLHPSGILSLFMDTLATARRLPILHRSAICFIPDIRIRQCSTDNYDSIFIQAFVQKYSPWFYRKIKHKPPRRSRIRKLRHRFQH